MQGPALPSTTPATCGGTASPNLTMSHPPGPLLPWAAGSWPLRHPPGAWRHSVNRPRLPCRRLQRCPAPPVGWGGAQGPSVATPAPRSLTCCCLPCAPRRGLLKRSQGPQVTPAGCPQWPPCTCGPLPTGPGWAATCWGLFWPLGGCPPPALLGFSMGSFLMSACLSYNAGLPTGFLLWEGPLQKVSPKRPSEPPTAMLCHRQLRSGREGQGLGGWRA